MPDLIPVNKAAQMLAQANTPKETHAIESMAQAAKAWAKEQNNYEAFVAAAHLYIMARRKTTELILPEITHGGNNQGNKAVTLNGFGFTRMQWYRRVKELEIETAMIDEYFDKCISAGWEPNLFGLMRYHNGGNAPIQHADWCDTKKPCNCGAKHAE
jgi:hypothetical protein